MNFKATIVKTFPQSTTLKAVATLTINDCFIIHGVKVIDSEKGMFIAMPSHKRDERYLDICHPLDSETRQMMTEAVLTAYAASVPAVSQ